MNSLDPVTLQRDYYQRTAAQYDLLHMRADDEHYHALAWLAGLVSYYEVKSVLDVGCGTGRAIRYLETHCPHLKITGLEPSDALRTQAANSTSARIVDGDAASLAFPDCSFDLVCEFGVLHHLSRPRLALQEMMRVSKMGIFVSDDNHFAAGSKALRKVKLVLRACGLWSLAYRIRTGGKGYRISEGDGLSYPYSVFDDLDILQNGCDKVFCASTDGGDADLLRTASHVAVFGRKRGLSAV